MDRKGKGVIYKEEKRKKKKTPSLGPEFRVRGYRGSYGTVSGFFFFFSIAVRTVTGFFFLPIAAVDALHHGVDCHPQGLMGGIFFRACSKYSLFYDI